MLPSAVLYVLQGIYIGFMYTIIYFFFFFTFIRFLSTLFRIYFVLFSSRGGHHTAPMPPATPCFYVVGVGYADGVL